MLFRSYSTSFKTVVVFLAAVGLILTPIYLLSMLREVFYGEPTENVTPNCWQWDANPREVFIALCLLVPIVGIGLYPKLVMDSYDGHTVAVAEKLRAALPVVAQGETPVGLAAVPFTAPELD